MKLQIDPLFDIFKRHLDNALIEDQPTEQTVITNVVNDYMKLINSRGIIPKRLEQFLEDDIREEAVHMLKKTTYGHFGFSSYKTTRLTAIEKMKLRGC